MKNKKQRVLVDKVALPSTYSEYKLEEFIRNLQLLGYAYQNLNPTLSNKGNEYSDTNKVCLDCCCNQCNLNFWIERDETDEEYAARLQKEKEEKRLKRQEKKKLREIEKEKELKIYRALAKKYGPIDQED